MRPMNCWEFMSCGREPSGLRTSQYGVCPAAEDTRFEGLNRGINGGRVCWAVAGTLCDTMAQGLYIGRQFGCQNCRFFQKVKEEEGKEGFFTFKPTETSLK